MAILVRCHISPPLIFLAFGGKDWLSLMLLLCISEWEFSHCGSFCFRLVLPVGLTVTEILKDALLLR